MVKSLFVAQPATTTQETIPVATIQKSTQTTTPVSPDVSKAQAKEVKAENKAQAKHAETVLKANSKEVKEKNKQTAKVAKEVAKVAKATK